VPWSGGSVVGPNFTFPSTSQTFDGNGRPQCWGTSGSQSAPRSGRPPVGSGAGASVEDDFEHPSARTMDTTRAPKTVWTSVLCRMGALIAPKSTSLRALASELDDETYAVLRGARPRASTTGPFVPTACCSSAQSGATSLVAGLPPTSRTRSPGCTPARLGSTARPERPHDPGSVREMPGRSSSRSASRTRRSGTGRSHAPRARASDRDVEDHGIAAREHLVAGEARDDARTRRVHDVREVTIEPDGAERCARQPKEQATWSRRCGAESAPSSSPPAVRRAGRARRPISCRDRGPPPLPVSTSNGAGVRSTLPSTTTLLRKTRSETGLASTPFANRPSVLRPSTTSDRL